jgi:hypothetical protein
MTTLDQRPNFLGSIWERWVQFVEFIDRRKFLSVQDWLYVLNILEDANRDLNISDKSRSEILKIVKSQQPFLKKLRANGDGDIGFPIAMNMKQYDICVYDICLQVPPQ